MVDFAALVAQRVAATNRQPEREVDRCPADCRVDDDQALDSPSNSAEGDLPEFLSRLVQEGCELVIDDRGEPVLVPDNAVLAKELDRLRALLREALTEVGVRFGDISEEAQHAAAELLMEFKVEPVHVTTDVQAVEIMVSLAEVPDTDMVGIDIETCPLPQWREKRQVICLTERGRLAKKQSRPAYGPGLDPHRAETRTVQIYWGGPQAFVFDLASPAYERDGVCEWLETVLPLGQLANWPRTPSGGLSTAGKHLRRSRDIHPGLDLLADWSQLAQRVSTYGYPLLDKLSFGQIPGISTEYEVLLHRGSSIRILGMEQKVGFSLSMPNPWEPS